MKTFVNKISDWYAKPIHSASFEQISGEEVVYVLTGEIISTEEKNAKIQKACGTEYAVANADIPLYQQNVKGSKLRVAITGKFDAPRASIVAALNAAGIDVGSSVNKKTDVLVIGEWGLEVGADGVSNKYLDAIEMGVEVLKMDSAQSIFAHFSA